MKRGALIALLVIIVIILGLFIVGGFIYLQFTQEPYVPQKAYLKIELGGAISETAQVSFPTMSGSLLSIHDLWLNCDALVLTVIQKLADMPAFLREKFRDSAKPVVVNKGGAEPIGRDSVYYLQDNRMEAPCDRLYELGHRRILLVDQVTRQQGEAATIHPNMKGFEEIFHRKYPDVEYNTKLMAFEVPLYRQPHPLIFQAFAERRAELEKFTAVVCPMSFYLVVVAGLRQSGLRVPEDVSVLAFGDRLEAEYYDPRPTAFSVLLRDQAYRTLELIGWRLRNPGAAPVNIQTAVQFFEGKSFAPANPNR